MNETERSGTQEQRVENRRTQGALAWLLRLGRRGLPPGNVLVCGADGVVGVEAGIEALEKLAEAEPRPTLVYVRELLPDMSVVAFLRQCEVLQPLTLRATVVDVAGDGYDNCITVDASATPTLLDDLRRLALLTESMRALHVRTRDELLERVDAQAALHSERRRLVRYLRALHYGAEAGRDRHLATVLEYLGLRDDVQLQPRPLLCGLHDLLEQAANAADIRIDNLVGQDSSVSVDIDLFTAGVQAAFGGLSELCSEFGLNEMPLVRVSWRSGLLMELPALQVPLSRLDELVQPFRLREDGGPAGMQLAHAHYLAGAAGVPLDIQPGPHTSGVRLFWALADAAVGAASVVPIAPLGDAPDSPGR